MVYGKEKFFPNEKELHDFMQELTFCWTEGFSAKKIAKEMKFGEPEPEGYPKLKIQHIYYFIKKYGYEWEGVEPRRKVKKEPEKEEKKVQVGIPHLNDMPYEVVHYLRTKSLLIE